jgi:chromosome segregation ATPase
MSLALRRASDKYTHIESVLRERMFELATLKADFRTARSESDVAAKQVTELKTQLQEVMRERRGVEQQVKHAIEQRTMTDLALQDYASLVRTLEKNNGSTPLTLPEEALSQGRLGLSRLLSEHSSEVELLHSQVAELQSQADGARQELAREKEASESLKAELADMHLALEQIRSDDSGAAKVVARYMYAYKIPPC